MKKSALIAVAALLLSTATAQAEVLDDRLFFSAAIEQLEYRFDEDHPVAAWEAEVRLGGDVWKTALESEAEYDLNADEWEALENQFIVRRTASTFFDLKGGVRFDTPHGPDRWYATLGLEGLAPQWVESDLDFFVSSEGKWSARLEAEYEILLTNYLILQPLAEVDYAFSADDEIEIGRGFSKAELGARLRYELIDRDVSVYVGGHWETLLGDTADKAESGEDATFRLVAGLRLLF